MTKIIEDIKPHQIYAAGDLADPHGTHKICLNSLFESIEQLKSKKFMKDCWVWLYRGAWHEWETYEIEMAVPLSPNQVLELHESEREFMRTLRDKAHEHRGKRHHHNPEDDEAMASTLRGLLNNKDVGDVVIDSATQTTLPERLRERLSASVSPTVLGIGTEEDTTLRDTIRKAIGVDLWK